MGYAMKRKEGPRQPGRGSNLCLRSTLRQPVRSLCLVLLWTLVSFAAFTQIIQVSVLGAAVKEIGGYYHATGGFSPLSGDPDQHDVTSCLELLEDSVLVDFVDVRRYGTYTMDDYLTADTMGLFNSPSIAAWYVRGTVNNIEIQEGNFSHILVSSPAPTFNFTDKSNQDFSYQLTGTLSNYEVVAGMTDFLSDLPLITFRYYSNDRSELEAIAKQLVPGENMLLKLHNQAQTKNMDLFWLSEFGQGLYACSTDRLEGSDPAMEGVTEDMELLNTNIRSSAFYTTKDMTAIANFDQTNLLVDGRLLNRADDLTENRVCVISQDLARSAGLQVGDTLGVTLWNLTSPGPSIRTDLEGKSLDQLESVHENLNIVGIFQSTTAWAKSEGYYGIIYLPDSVLPAHYDRREIANNSWTSVVLKSADEEDAFLLRYDDAFRALGWQFTFAPNGWANFSDAARPLARSAWTSALLFSGAGTAVFGLALFLYLMFRRKELAILRALGCPGRRVVSQAALPLSMIAGIGILCGALGAYRLGLRKAEETLARLSSEVSLSVGFPLWKLIPMLLIPWVAWMLVGLAGLRLLVRRPILSELQAQGGKRAVQRPKTTDSLPGDLQQPPLQGLSTAPIHADMPPTKVHDPAFPRSEPSTSLKTSRGIAWSLRWIRRHVTRQPLRLLLSICAAAGFLVGLGYLQNSIFSGMARVDQLYQRVQVSGQVLQNSSEYIPGGGILPSEAAKALEESGMLQHTVKTIGDVADLVSDETEVCLPQITLRGIWRLEDLPDTPEVTWLEGSSESIFFQDSGSQKVLLSWEVMDQLGVALGDTVAMVWPEFTGSFRVVGAFSGQMLDYNALFNGSTLATLFEQHSHSYAYASYAFDLDPGQNRQLPVFQGQAEAIVQDCGGPTELILVLRDQELTQAVEPLERNVELLRVLYPAMQVLSVLVGAGLAVLFTLQSTREAAILRVLGCWRRRALLLLLCRQLFPTLVGLLAGAAILAALPLHTRTADCGFCLLLYLMGCLLGGLVSAAATLRRNPLPLLQIKE